MSRAELVELDQREKSKLMNRLKDEERHKRSGEKPKQTVVGRYKDQLSEVIS